MENVEISTGEGSFDAKLADTYLSRMKGLSFRSDGKMLFVFPRDTRAKIDMMFLSDPLHLYFLNEDRRVIDVQRAEPWSWNPRSWRLYSPGRPYRYLIESFNELGLEEGDQVEF